VATATIPAKDAPVPITGDNSADESEHFTSVNSNYGSQNSGSDSDQVVQLYLLPHNHTTIGSDSTNWTPLMKDTDLSNGGDFYLTEDLTKGLTVPQDKTVNLCLNGQTLTGGITVNGTLNLYDCKGGGTLGKTGTQPVTGSGTWNFNGGTVTITTPNGKTETVTVPTGGTVDPEDCSKPTPGPAPSYGSDDDDDEPTYPPTVEKAKHGIVTVRPSEPEQGDRVTITVKTDKGYEVKEVTVTDRNGIL